MHRLKFLSLFAIFTTLAAIAAFPPTVVFADNPTGLEPPQTAYIEAQQSPDGTVAYKIKNLFNKDWLANAKVTWKAHISCGTFTGTTFNPAGCGNLKTINENNTEMRICVFLEHTNGQILFGSYPERGFTHGFGDALHTPNADELICYGSTQERAPVPGSPQNPAGQPAPQPGAQPNSQPKSSGTPWIIGGLILLIVGGAVVYVKKKKKNGEKIGDDQPQKKRNCEAEAAALEKKKADLEKAKAKYERLKALHQAYMDELKNDHRVAEEAFVNAGGEGAYVTAMGDHAKAALRLVMAKHRYADCDKAALEYYNRMSGPDAPGPTETREKAPSCAAEKAAIAQAQTELEVIKKVYEPLEKLREAYLKELRAKKIGPAADAFLKAGGSHELFMKEVGVDACTNLVEMAEEAYTKCMARAI